MLGHRALVTFSRLRTNLSSRAGLLAGIMLILGATLLYTATLDDGLRLAELRGGDLITHQYAQAQGRLANAPGYPIYTMLGWLWFRVGRALLPWLNATQVLSLFSTIWALAALAVLYVLLLEVSNHWFIACSTAGFYAVTYFFWYYAVTSEQYASAVLQTLLFVLWAFRWQRTRADRYLLYSALNIGLCLSHLVTVLFIVPALLVFYLKEDPQFWRRGRLLRRMALLALLPLLSYAYVFYVGATHPEWRGAGQWNTAWQWFVSFLSTAQGRAELTWRLGPLTEEFPWLMARELTWGVLAIGLAGLCLLGRRRATLISITLAVYLAFGYIDRYGNWYQVIMPIYPLVLLGFAAALTWLWERIQGRWSMIGRGTLVAGLLALVAVRLIVNWPRADQSGRPDDDAIPLARALLADRPSPGAWLYGTSDEYAALMYVTSIWGERRDVTPATTAEVRQWLTSADARPLYVTRGAIQLCKDEVGLDAPLWAAGKHLIEVLREPRTDVPSDASNLDWEIYPGLQLAGIQDLSDSANELHIALYWRATASLEPAAVSVRPIQAGSFLAQGDQLVAQDHQPVWNAYPFAQWRLGEVVRDDYVIPLPAGTTPDGVRVILYRPDLAGSHIVGTVDVPLPRK